MAAQRLPKNWGRRTKYSSSLLNEVDKYLESATKENQHLPKIESLAVHLGVVRKTLYNWAKKHKEFDRILEYIKLLQEERLIDDGIYGGKEINASIVKLILSNNHGYRDKSDITTDNKPINSNPYTNEQIDRIAKRRIAKRSGNGKSTGKK